MIARYRARRCMDTPTWEPATAHRRIGGLSTQPFSHRQEINTTAHWRSPKILLGWDPRRTPRDRSFDFWEPMFRPRNKILFVTSSPPCRVPILYKRQLQKIRSKTQYNSVNKILKDYLYAIVIKCGLPPCPPMSPALSFPRWHRSVAWS